MKRQQPILLILVILCLGSAAGCSGQPSADDPARDSGEFSNLNPKAVAVNTFSGDALTLVSPQRETIGSIAVANSDNLWSDNVVFTGKLDGNSNEIPFVYTTYTPEVTIQLHQGGSDQVLRKFNSLGGIVGSSGEPVIAFSEVVFSDYSLNSNLYVGNLDSVGFSTAVYENEDYLNQWVLTPLAVDLLDGQPSGVWYTTSGWGVGGPGMFFPGHTRPVLFRQRFRQRQGIFRRRPKPAGTFARPLTGCRHILEQLFGPRHDHHQSGNTLETNLPVKSRQRPGLRVGNFRAG